MAIHQQRTAKCDYMKIRGSERILKAKHKVPVADGVRTSLN